MNNKKLSISKQIFSITDISKMLQMSRARFYQLLGMGFFPKPLYDDRSKRPYYNLELQVKCLECRQSGIGIDGSFMLFYSPRKKETAQNSKKVNAKQQTFSDIYDTLKQMGLNCSYNDVSDAVTEIYPDGIEEIEQGVVVRDVFRYLKSK